MTECLVLPGIGGLAVQALLMACCGGVFYLKLQNEEKSLGLDARSRGEFILDASKQVFGAIWLHCMNLGFAIVSSGDECEWYWINIMVDTTLGTAVSYLLLRIAMAFIKKKFTEEEADDFKPGEYKTDLGQIDNTKYWKQLFVWLVVVSCMKILMAVFMFLFSGPLLAIAGVILAPFLMLPWLKLLVVMIVCPLIMDGFQIWMVDNFLKRKPVSLNGPDDLEMSVAHEELAADALMNFSQRLEEVAHNSLVSLKARYDEAMHSEAYHGEQLTELPQKFMQLPQKGDSFGTQPQFQTIIRPDDHPEQALHQSMIQYD